MSDVTKYKKLNEVDHILKRPGILLGSTANADVEKFILTGSKFQLKPVSYNPGLLKLFDEVISNSVDEHIRSGAVKNIHVDCLPLTQSFRIRDDGGIPVVKHPVYKTYVPEMIFGELRAGSNFEEGDEVRDTAGMNGIGSKLVNIFSTEFKVTTCDGTNRYQQSWTDNSKKKTAYMVSASTTKGTTIEFTPDYDRLRCTLDDGNLAMIKARVYQVAACNSGINVYFNDRLIRVGRFSDYVDMFTTAAVHDKTDAFEVAVAPAQHHYQVSFVNGIDTCKGGTHVDYILNQIVTLIRTHISVKHKVDVRPAIIKQHIALFAKCKIASPMFTSQAKEEMCSEPKNFGATYKPSKAFVNKILSSAIVSNIVSHMKGEVDKAENAVINQLNKQSINLKSIIKFDDASSKNRRVCDLILTEGDSAAKTILSARDPSKVGVFPMKGKFMNVRNFKDSVVAANEEFQSICAIMGLKVKQKVENIDQLRFSRIIIATDQDPDGMHIRGLMFNMFNHYWPELFDLGVICVLSTPLIIATTKKDTHEFFSTAEYKAWSETAPKHTSKYFKGLGTFDTKMFKKYLTDPSYIVTMSPLDDADRASLAMAFDEDKADVRKVWLSEAGLDHEI